VVAYTDWFFVEQEGAQGPAGGRGTTSAQSLLKICPVCIISTFSFGLFCCTQPLVTFS
jgi:hypothetical protein